MRKYHYFENICFHRFLYFQGPLKTPDVPIVEESKGFENIHKDLAKLMNVASNNARVKVHESLLRALEEKDMSSEEKKKLDHYQRDKLDLNHFENESDYMEHHEFVDEKHHEFVEKLLHKMITEIHPKNYLLVYEFVKGLHDRTKNIHDEHFEEYEAEHKDKKNAKTMHDIIDNAHDLLKERIQMQTKTDEKFETDEDLYHFLINHERDNLHDILGKTFDEFDKYSELEDYHHDHIEKHHKDKTDNLHSLISDHVKEWSWAETANSKTTIEKASDEDYERFNDKNIIPTRIHEACIQCVAPMFKGLKNWAIVSSVAVGIISENSPDSIDDIDINFDVRDSETVVQNLEELKKQGLVYMDNQGKSIGFENTMVDVIGESHKLKGYFKIKNPDTGDDMFVEFEAFGESEGKGISQIGYIERDLVSLDIDGANIQVLGQKDLIDFYIVSALSEFGLDTLESFMEDETVKAKDLMRLEKLRLLGVALFEGIIDAINRTYEKYPKTKESKLQNIFKKKEEFTTLLEKIDKEFKRHMEGAKGLDKKTFETENEAKVFENFSELFKAMTKCKMTLGKDYEKLNSINSVQDILDLHNKIMSKVNEFNHTFNKIKHSPEGKALHYFAMRRFIEEFMTNMYQSIDIKITDILENKTISNKDYEEIIKILHVGEKYSELYINNKLENQNDVIVTDEGVVIIK